MLEKWEGPNGQHSRAGNSTTEGFETAHAHQGDIWPLYPYSYEGWFRGSDPHAISLQPLGEDHATMPHMKAKDVPFHMGYGVLICSKALQSDRAK